MKPNKPIVGRNPLQRRTSPIVATVFASSAEFWCRPNWEIPTIFSRGLYWLVLGFIDEPADDVLKHIEIFAEAVDE